MKNKDFRFSLLISLILTLVFIISITMFNYNFIKQYESNNNFVIANIIANIKEEYPDYDDVKLMEILNNDKIELNDFFKKYGIDFKDSLSISNQKLTKKMIIINLSILLIYILFIILTITFFNYKENKKIKQITNYIKEINNKNYELDILSNSEEDLSLLKNEIYKTAVTLNEQAKYLTKDKETLKDSLSDISHQLKTPLTSITLMIDTLQKNKNLPEEKKKEMLTNIHHKIANINFLVQSLLKLSKFDANTIVFKNELNKVDDILNEVTDNLSTLIDLKNIKINIKGNKKDKLYCDFKWQVEALTNIIKNCIEYSNESSNIDISYSSNDLFTKIIIKDYGKGMSHEDEKHIFERFYKGENSSSDSVGIGLALSQSIIEKDNGYITVESKIGIGTTFTIKYLK